MAILSVEGNFGAGKSAFAVWLAHTDYIARGVRTWANFSLQGAIPIREIGMVCDCQDWPHPAGCGCSGLYLCNDGLIVLDEVQKIMHARKSSGKDNLPFMEWFDQCRKHGSDLILITQMLRKMDVLAREMVDLGFYCQNIGGMRSKVTVIKDPDVRPKVVRQFIFDRRWAFGLYNHRARAWRLEGAGTQRQEKQERERTPGASAAIAEGSGTRIPALSGVGPFIRNS